MKKLFGAALATMMTAAMLAPDLASAMPAQSLTGVAPAAIAQAEPIAYRRRAVAPRRAMAPRRVYARRRGYDPGPAFLGAIAGMAGAGIAASQADRYYYRRGYGYPVYPAYPIYPGYGYDFEPW